jgi:hypothetical protein
MAKKSWQMLLWMWEEGRLPPQPWPDSDTVSIYSVKRNQSLQTLPPPTPQKPKAELHGFVVGVPLQLELGLQGAGS